MRYDALGYGMSWVQIILLPITEFLDTEITPAIKPTSKNKGNTINSKYRLNGRDLRYLKYMFYIYKSFVLPK